MNSRDRLLAALNHREPDRVPFDLGSTDVTGIHVAAYQNLRGYLGLPRVEPHLYDHMQQLALPDDDVVERFRVDVRGLFPLNSRNWRIVKTDRGDAWEYIDEWSITHHRLKPDGACYSVVRHPLGGTTVTLAQVQAHPWPNVADPQRIAKLREQAFAYREQGRAVILNGVLGGVFETACRLRGSEYLVDDLTSNETLACTLLDKILELKLAFWEMALPQLVKVIDVICEEDDYNTPISQILSPRLFRKIMKPRLKTLFDRIGKLAPRVPLFFHSCGNTRPLLPDFFQLGVDVVNPVDLRAMGVEAATLKREYGNDLVFWGGGVDCNEVLPHGTPKQVRENVQRNIEALAPGGGFVFSIVNNIQPDVPPQNIVAMREALEEYGAY
jgi:uroporphyrinogen decarboxylase